MFSNSAHGNKKIAVNSIIIYIQMILGVLISFFTTRYVLSALGVSDYGLYNVVGGTVTMLNFISVGMHTTTRRYVNVEMGKREGNVNKIFNICLVLHLGFALLIYVVALTFGLWYINNVLNVSYEKLSDARFVYFISTTVSAIGIINVPYQALMAAYERFLQIASIGIGTLILRIPFILALILYTGNHLRFFAVGECLLTMLSLLLFSTYCLYSFKEITKWHIYKDITLYKEILVFNNYTALGAFAYLGRSQGSTMVINYFFGTLVNGAFAIAIQIERQLQNFVGNLTVAANPQMTQSYSSGDFQRSFNIVCKIARYSGLIMAILTFSLFVSLEPLLTIWLNKIPLGAITFCQAMLLSLFYGSLSSGVDGLIQATGNVKMYQIIQSILLTLGIPLSILLFILGAPPVYILYTFIGCDIMRSIAMYIIVCRITPFSFSSYALSVFLPVLRVIMIYLLYYILLQMISFDNLVFEFLGFVFTLIFCSIVAFRFGMTMHERQVVLKKILNNSVFNYR